MFAGAIGIFTFAGVLPRASTYFLRLGAEAVDEHEHRTTGSVPLDVDGCDGGSGGRHSVHSASCTTRPPTETSRSLHSGWQVKTNT